MNSILVKKRDGSTEPLDINKIHLMTELATVGIDGVSSSLIEVRSQMQFYNGISTKDIQDILIKTAGDLISLETPNYQWVATKLAMFSLRKEVWGSEKPKHLKEMMQENFDKGLYDIEVFESFSDDDLETLNSFIDHDRDFLIPYCGVVQALDKYLVQDRTTKKIFETPQYAYILISAALFANYDASVRMSYIKKYYDAISKQSISLPTPLIAGVRTKTRQYASCVLIECGDTLDSINATVSSVVRYAANRAGLGVHMGNIRGVGSKVRSGEVKHTGIIPYLHYLQSGLNSVHQGGIRKASSTITVPVWHYEIEDVLVLKNNKGTEDNRVRHLDYSIAISKIFYERYINGEKITLFSPEQVPELVKSYGTSEFDELYLKAENRKGIRKKRVDADEIFESLARERRETGRIYVLNIDHFNSHSSFDIPLKMSNLCVDGDTKISIKINDLEEVISIKDLYILDKEVSVLSKNLLTNTIEYSKIKDFAKTGENQTVLEIHDVDSGKTLLCTPNHQVFTKNRGYVEAKDLTETDILDIV